jgi:hypothetical protein
MPNRAATVTEWLPGIAEPLWFRLCRVRETVPDGLFPQPAKESIRCSA